jgi:hypothetical protein
MLSFVEVRLIIRLEGDSCACPSLRGVLTEVFAVYLPINKLSEKEVDRENLLAWATAMSSFIGIESGEVHLSFRFLWFSSFNAKAEKVCLKTK